MSQEKPIAKIILTQKESKPYVRFSPSLTKENIKEHLDTLLDAFPYALLSMLATFPMMRPATEEERQAHVYVFQEGSIGENENKVYKSRKAFYDKLAAVFSSVLSIGFGDVEYIESCAKYQQDYVLDHTDEEHDAYLEDIKSVTAYVREHYEEILHEMDKEDNTMV